MVTHSNYNFLAQQDVSEKKRVKKRSITVSLAKSCANTIRAGVGSRFDGETKHLHENVCNRFENGAKGEALLCSALLSQRFQLLTRRMI